MIDHSIRYLFISLLLIFALGLLCFSSLAELPDELVNNEDDSFSVIWYGDTQKLTEEPNLSQYIPPMFSFIDETKERLNTLAVVHSGDIVENGWNDLYWDRINSGIGLIPEDIPFIPAAGNHDVAKNKQSYEPWLKQPFVKNQKKEHQYLNGAGYYDIVEFGGTAFLFIAIGYNSIDEQGLEWMRNVLDSHPDHVGIIVFHSILSFQKEKASGYTKLGKKLLDEVAEKCSNVRLMLCGHFERNAYRVHTYIDNGVERKVHILRQNYQASESPSLIGFLRILRFSVSRHTIEVFTYSPVTGATYYKGDKSKLEHILIEDAF